MLRNPRRSVMGIQIKAEDYRDRSFIIGIDTEKVISAGLTGENTKAGFTLNAYTEAELSNPNSFSNHRNVCDFTFSPKFSNQGYRY